MFEIDLRGGQESRLRSGQGARGVSVSAGGNGREWKAYSEIKSIGEFGGRGGVYPAVNLRIENEVCAEWSIFLSNR